MAPVVAIHGIGNQYAGESVMHCAWFPAMRDGLLRAGGDLRSSDVACVFYGDLFRPSGRLLGENTPMYDAADVCDGFESELLTLWWSEAAKRDAAVVPPDAPTLARTPKSAQKALNALSNSRFFSGVAERLMVLSLKQVRRYFTDDSIRAQVTARIARNVDADTRVLVGHSLGSVAAYEALCGHPEWPVRALVTLGSPLGIRDLVFDRLRPRNGVWPRSVTTWTNIADEGDVVALRKDLRPLFGDQVRNITVHCGAKAHDVTRYLTAEAVGQAIRAGVGDD